MQEWIDSDSPSLINLKNTVIIDGNNCKLVAIIENMACGIRKINNIQAPPVPTSIIPTITNDGTSIEIITVPFKRHHGAVLYDNGKWIIYLRDKDSLATKRFTVFHEMFHILYQTRVIHSHFKNMPPQGPFIEFLANWFAAAILMPGEWLQKYYTEECNGYELSELFNVPYPIICARLKRLAFL